MSIYVAKNGQLQTVNGIYYAMTEDYINANLFHNLIPMTATEIKFLYASDNPDLTGYQKLGYADNNNFIEVWNNGTKYILINPRKNYIYAPTYCGSFLSDYTALTNCIFDNFDTRNTTDMYQMFYKCNSLVNLDLSSFNTQNISDMSNMFQQCASLISIDLSSFDTQNVTSMLGMFYKCTSLTSLNLTSFNTVKVKQMYTMFAYCNRLTSIVSNTFNSTALTSSNDMFTGCTSLVGGNGTTYSSSHLTAEYARVDGENDLPGYFTAPTN